VRVQDNPVGPDTVLQEMRHWTEGGEDVIFLNPDGTEHACLGAIIEMKDEDDGAGVCRVCHQWVYLTMLFVKDQGQKESK